MKIKVSASTPIQLNWLVAKCEGRFYGIAGTCYEFQPSRLWAQGGPIIEREKINTKSNLTRMPNHPDYDWQADCPEKGQCVSYHGPTPLIAAMRCYVASKLGDEVDVPEELCP